MTKIKEEREDLYNRMHAGISIHAKRLFAGQPWESLMVPDLWDALHESKLWSALYDAGFTDKHIASAVRQIHRFGPL